METHTNAGDGYEVDLNSIAGRCPSKRKKEAKRRWTLLRNMKALGIRRSSLSMEESAFLSQLEAAKKEKEEDRKEGEGKENLSSITEDGPVVLEPGETEASSSSVVRPPPPPPPPSPPPSTPSTTAARRKLRRSIAIKSAVLTPIEKDFLTDLVETEGLSRQALENAEKVLEGDSAYRVSVVREEEEDEEEPAETKEEKKRRNRRESLKVRRESIRKLPVGPKFREELWEGMYASTEEYDTNDYYEEEEEEDEEPEAAPREEDENKFHSFFKKLLSKDDVMAPSPKTEPSPKAAATTTPKDDDEPKRVQFAVLGTSPGDDETSPRVLSPPIMDALRHYMPYVVQEDNYWLKYSLVRDGASLDALLSKVRSSSRTVLAIETTDGRIFGSFTSSPWRSNGDRFYGSCESFLWEVASSRYDPTCVAVLDQVKLESKVDVHSWAGSNRNIQSSNRGSVSAGEEPRLAVGGGAPDEDHGGSEGNVSGMESVSKDDWGFGFCLNGDMSVVTSDPCVTFGTADRLGGSGLAKMGRLDVSNLEVWTMTPCNDERQAERLELGRQFVFDQGHVAKQ